MNIPLTLEELEAGSPGIKNAKYTQVSVQELGKFNIMHLYSTGVDGDTNYGYARSIFFRAWAFNSTDGTCALSPRMHDGIFLLYARSLKFWEDGSIYVELGAPVESSELSNQAFYGSPSFLYAHIASAYLNTIK